MWEKISSKAKNTFRFSFGVLLSCLLIVIALKQTYGYTTKNLALEQLIGKPIAQQIKTHVRAISSVPHYAGTDASIKNAQYYAQRLREYGFDEVIFNRYEVLLPRPIKRSVTLLQPESYNLKLNEPPIAPDPDSSNQALLPPFNPYAADGDVTAPVVYVNFGLKEDYAVLDSMGISVKGFGANDPVAGASSLLETARIIGTAAKQGHRPQRSIAIASWDAEEYGMIGSTEYGEEFQSSLKGNLVVYLNREFSIVGDFYASGVASLQPLLNQITKEVQMPNSDKSIFETWLASQKNNTINVNGMQQIPLRGLGAGSDFMVFMHHLGVPSLDFGFGSSYGAYHSRYDSYWFFKNYGDPNAAYGQKLTELVSLFLLRIADAKVLPFDYVSYSNTIDSYINGLAKVFEQQKVALNLDKIRSANAELKTNAIKLNAEIAKITTIGNKDQKRNRQAISQLNTLLITAESAFLDQNGLPRRPWYRHQIYAPGYNTEYNAIPIPGVREAIDRGDISEAQQMTIVLEGALNRVRDTLQQAIVQAQQVK